MFEFFDDRNSYGGIRILTYIMGFWPKQSVPQRYLWAVISTLACSMVYVPEIFAAIEFYDDEEVILELIAPFMTNFVSVTKTIVNMYHTNIIKSLFYQIKEDLDSFVDENEFAAIYSHARFAKVLAHGYLGAITISVTMFTIEPLIPRAINFVLNNNKTTPLRFSVPIYLYGVDLEKYYYIIMFFIGIGIIMVIYLTVASDIMFIVLLQHAAGLFAVTGYLLENIPTKENLDAKTVRNNSLTLEQIQYKHYTRCIKLHKRAIKYSEDLELVYGWCFGIIILINVPLMSVTATQVTTQARNVEQFIKYGIVVVSQLTHLFFDCYLSQRLMNYSSLVQESVMAGQWYVSSPRVQKLVTLITLRSQLPCKLTAGKIMVLSLETYTAFVKTAGSYFTVMNSMR